MGWVACRTRIVHEVSKYTDMRRAFIISIIKQDRSFLQGSGTLLVRLYKDAGTPVTECLLTKF